MYRAMLAAVWIASLFTIGCHGEQAPKKVHAASPDPKSRLVIRNQDGAIVLAANQIVEYRWKTHTMVLTPGFESSLRSSLKRSDLIGGVPFVVIADGVPCYSGIFTTSYSSISQDCPVIDIEPVKKQPDLLTIQLGYPTDGFFSGDDPRSEERIRVVLKELNLLRE